MMQKTLAFVHTSHVLIPVFSELAATWLPGVETFHVVDESLIRNTIRAGALTRTTQKRTVALIGLAHEGGAGAVMLTCSSIGPSVDAARCLYDFPVFRIDEAMAESAVSFSRIGVAATLSTTLEPTVALLRRTAANASRSVAIVPKLCADAFTEVLAGNTARHDELVASALLDLAPQSDVIVLAQASMARVLSRVASLGVPVLSSPELAIRQVRDVLLGTQVSA